MNQDNFDKWCGLLTSGEVDQASGVLVEHGAGGRVGMCCLGVGMHAMGRQFHLSDEDPDDTGFVGEDKDGEFTILNSLPSWEFLEWLGLIPEGGAEAKRVTGSLVSDIAIRFNDFEVFIEPDSESTYSIDNTDWTTCAGMNDNGFTFAQIVDCMRYFGIEKQG